MHCLAISPDTVDVLCTAARRLRRCLSLAGLGVLSLSGAAAAQVRPADPPRNIVYVESNVGTPGGNAILAFQRDAAGNLTPLPGSPFPTGGTGVVDLSLALGPNDADQQIITNPPRSLLFAVNMGSNSIAVFHILSDGSLSPVNGSPFPSGGVDPVSVGLAGNVLVVVNK